jgi:hypothetical protein
VKLIDFIREICSTKYARIINRIVIDPSLKWCIVYLKVKSEEDIVEAKELHKLASRYFLTSIALAKRVKLMVIRERVLE